MRSCAAKCCGPWSKARRPERIIVPWACDPRCAAIAHLGRFDGGIAMEGVEALTATAHPTAQIFVYEAGHGFNSDRRKDYHEESSELARERTLALFRACGG